MYIMLCVCVCNCLCDSVTCVAVDFLEGLNPTLNNQPVNNFLFGSFTLGCFILMWNISKFASNKNLHQWVCC